MKTTFFKSPFLPAFLVALFAIALYANTIGHSFVYDDSAAVTNNYMVKQGISGIPELLKTSYHRGYFVSFIQEETYRPFSLIIFSIIYQFFGQNPMPYHLLNIILYGLTGFFLYTLLRKLFVPNLTTELSLRGETTKQSALNATVIASEAKQSTSSLSMTAFQENGVLIAFITSLIFIAHPIHTEVVANIKSADELFSFLFIIFTFLVLLKFLERGPALIHVRNEGWGIELRPVSLLPLLAFITFFLSLISKEGSITMFGLIPLTLWFFKNVPWKKLLLIILTLFAAAIPYLIMRKLAIGTVSGVKPTLFHDNVIAGAPTLSIKLATAFHILIHYIKLLFWPHPLSCDYSTRQFTLVTWSNTVAVTSVIIHAALLIVGLFLFNKTAINRNRRIESTLTSHIAFGILFYLLSMFLYSNLLLMIGTHFAERLLYVPLFGFSIIITALIFRVTSFKSKLITTVAYCFLACILIAYSYKTIARNTDWKNGLTLFGTDVNHSPNSARLHYLYGEKIVAEKIFDNKNQQEALMWAEIAMRQLDTAIFINRNYADAFGQRGNIFLVFGNKEEALKNYQQAVELNTNSESIINNLGILYQSMKQYQKALEYFNITLKINPRSAMAWQNAGSTYYELKRYDKSIESYLNSLKYEPNNAKSNFCLGSLYNALGDSASGRPLLEKSIRLDPALKNEPNPFKI